MTIGDIIKNRRKEMNMRQEDLAELVGTTKATVSRWESGDIHKMKRPMRFCLMGMGSTSVQSTPVHFTLSNNIR